MVMTKTQFFLNIILFIPLLVINFFVYGVDGCARFIKLLKEYKEYSKERK